MSAPGPPPPLQTSPEAPFSPPSPAYDREASPVTRDSPASRQSFLTAFTSSRQGTPVRVDSTEFYTPPLSPPLSLRKSLSVDSLVQYGRGATSKVSPRPSRVHTSQGLAGSRGLVLQVSTAPKRENDAFQRPSRLLGASVSGVGEEYDQSVVGDSDVERSDHPNQPGERVRRSSMKGPEKNRPFVRGGELPLPSRTPTLSLTSSISSVRGASSSPWEHAPRLQSASSMQSISRRGANTLVDIQPGRARSGSLGVYVTHSGKPMLINTRVSTRDTPCQNPEVTLAIVGAAGCGKTTVIRKGLKGYSLSEATVYLSSTAPLDIQAPPRYTRRIGRVTHNENTPDCPLHIFEVVAPISHLGQSTKESLWPDGAPRLDGVIICYDASDSLSFSPVEDLLHGYRALKLPTVVLACKSDLERQVEPQKALEVLQTYDVGLVEVANNQEGKEKMRRSFDWLLKAVYRERRSTPSEFNSQYRNPASPDLLVSQPPWEHSRTATPTASSSMTSMNTISQTQANLPHQTPVSTLTSRSPSNTNSPTRTRSLGDLLSEHERSRNREWQSERDLNGSNGITHLPNKSSGSLHRVAPSTGEVLSGFDEVRDDHHDSKEKEPRPTQWATLEELLDKLLFLAVSGDDPAFITHFLLTYRRFASPRSVLLAMQKRMRQLDNPSGDPMFACFAQMRICHLLETWIQDYPHDFAVRGTAGALSALIKSIIAKTYLLHYGSDFLPFLEVLPNLIDKDAAWALKPDNIADESDDSYSLCEDDDEATPVTQIGSSDSKIPSPTSAREIPVLPGPTSSRECKSSVPLTAKVLALPHITPTLFASQPDGSELSAKQLCRELVKVAHELNAIDSDDIAQEITRMGARLFLDIEPRHWLQYTFIPGKKDPQTDNITGFNEMSNHLADWVLSLILCHDRPKARAKQIEKFVDIAQKIRALNNYSALRAFVAGINNSTFPGDDTMEIFKSKSPDQAKHLRSWDLLLQHIRSHRAYRMALRNSKGACIPALEVHMSDLIRAHEGNPDENSNVPVKVHWGKYNMIGKFINSTTQCQAQCRNTTDYDFPDRPHIRNLIMKVPVMNDQVQKSRIAPPVDADGIDEAYRTQFPRMVSRDPNTGQTKDPLLRKFIFW